RDWRNRDGEPAGAALGLGGFLARPRRGGPAPQQLTCNSSPWMRPAADRERQTIDHWRWYRLALGRAKSQVMLRSHCLPMCQVTWQALSKRQPSSAGIGGWEAIAMGSHYRGGKRSAQ